MPGNSCVDRSWAGVRRERRLDHESGEAREFYRELQCSREPVRVGTEATGPIHWFERLLAELGQRDLRQLLWHRHKLVSLRTMLGNQLHFLAMSQALMVAVEHFHLRLDYIARYGLHFLGLGFGL